jgi:hypothetical protein
MKKISTAMRNSLLDDECKLVTLNEFLTAISNYKPTPVSVKLNTEHTAEVFAEHFKISLDHGKTWLPCGIEI